MPDLRPVLAASLAALAALPLAAVGVTPAASLAAPPAPASRPAFVLHVSAGTGVCAAATSPTGRVDNPCWLQLSVTPAVQLGPVELGVVYEGRDLIKAVTFLLVQPPGVTMLGASAGWVLQPAERWRLSVAAETGWRRYVDFAGSGVRDRSGAADTMYVGLTSRAALGLPTQAGPTNRLEVSVSIRDDLWTAHDTVDGVPWSVGGWSFTMGIGLVTEW